MKKFFSSMFFYFGFFVLKNFQEAVSFYNNKKAVEKKKKKWDSPIFSSLGSTYNLLSTSIQTNSVQKRNLILSAH